MEDTPFNVVLAEVQVALGDTIAFFTDEDFKKDDENLVCTASFETVGYGDNEADMWVVRVADAGGALERPVYDSCTTGTGRAHFRTKEELIEWMGYFGAKPV